MSFKAKTIDEWCEQKFPGAYNEKPNDAKELQKKLSENQTLVINDEQMKPLVVKPTRFERKCLVGKDEIPCYFHGWFQLNTPTKDGSAIAYPVGLVEHRDDGVMEQVKVTSIKFVEEFEE